MSTLQRILAVTVLIASIDSQRINSEQGHFAESEWGIAHALGDRRYQEDRYSTQIIDTIGNPILYSAFDGHLGSFVVDMSMAQLHNYITTSISIALEPGWGNANLTFAQTQKIKLAIVNGIINFDSHIYSNRDRIRGGSTFVGILQTKSHYFVINLGDSQARIYSSRTNTIVLKTKLHDLTDEAERRRIYAAGYSIVENKFVNRHQMEIWTRYIRHPVYRKALLAMPRCIGDSWFKTVQKGRNASAVIALPDIQIIAKSDYPKEMYGDLYAFLFSDGIGDLVQIAEKYSNSTAWPEFWRMNFMEQKPVNETNIMERWAHKIVSTMVQPMPNGRMQHDNMGILIAKLT